MTGREREREEKGKERGGAREGSKGERDGKKGNSLVYSENEHWEVNIAQFMSKVKVIEKTMICG